MLAGVYANPRMVSALKDKKKLGRFIHTAAGQAAMLMNACGIEVV